MKPATYTTALVALGFAPASVIDDLGYDIKGVTLLKRAFASDQLQEVYIIAPHWEPDTFLEASFNVYLAARPKKPKRLAPREAMQRGYAPVGGSIYRTLDELIAAVGKRYELPPEVKKGLDK